MLNCFFIHRRVFLDISHVTCSIVLPLSAISVEGDTWKGVSWALKMYYRYGKKGYTHQHQLCHQCLLRSGWTCDLLRVCRNERKLNIYFFFHIYTPFVFCPISYWESWPVSKISKYLLPSRLHVISFPSNFLLRELPSICHYIWPSEDTTDKCIIAIYIFFFISSVLQIWNTTILVERMWIYLIWSCLLCELCFVPAFSSICSL